MLRQLERLEQMLQVWEDQWFVYGVIAEYGARIGYPSGVQERFPFKGPLRHWRELRGHLRELGVNGRKLDSDRFTYTNTFIGEAHQSMLQYPLYLRDWTTTSRRVFHLGEEVQALLSAMSFNGIHWTDVTFPFDSFVISLEIPIASAIDSYDAIFVTRLYCPEVIKRRAGNGISVGLLSQNLQKYKRLSDLEKQLLLNGARRGKRSAARLINEFNARFPDPGPFTSCSIGVDTLESYLANDPIASHCTNVPLIGNLTNDTVITQNAVDQALRLIASLCLYLTSLPPGSPHKSEWVPPTRGKPDPRAITTDAGICTLTSVFTLNVEERKEYLSEHSGRETRAHFRRGHFRRHPGEGTNPSAPRTVLVRPALIRGDRLQPGELPAGSTGRVK